VRGDGGEGREGERVKRVKRAKSEGIINSTLHTPHFLNF
jgi:hypothetical protein